LQQTSTYKQYTSLDEEDVRPTGITNIPHHKFSIENTLARNGEMLSENIKSFLKTIMANKVLRLFNKHHHVVRKQK